MQIERSNLMFLLHWVTFWSDWANYLYFTREEIFPHLTGQSFWEQNSWIDLQVLHFQMKTNAASFPGVLGSWDELDIKPFLESAWVRFALAPLSLSLQQLSPVQLAVEMIYNLLDFAYTVVGAGIFRNSPSSRSESAMLSAESCSVMHLWLEVGRLCTNFSKFIHIFSDRFQAQVFWGSSKFDLFGLRSLWTQPCWAHTMLAKMITKIIRKKKKTR